MCDDLWDILKNNVMSKLLLLLFGQLLETFERFFIPVSGHADRVSHGVEASPSTNVVHRIKNFIACNAAVSWEQCCKTGFAMTCC